MSRKVKILIWYEGLSKELVERVRSVSDRVEVEFVEDEKRYISD